MDFLEGLDDLKPLQITERLKLLQQLIDPQKRKLDAARADLASFIQETAELRERRMALKEAFDHARTDMQLLREQATTLRERRAALRNNSGPIPTPGRVQPQSAAAPPRPTARTRGGARLGGSR